MSLKRVAAEQMIMRIAIDQLVQDFPDSMITANEMEEICAPCAAKMRELHVKSVKLSAVRDTIMQKAAADYTPRDLKEWTQKIKKAVTELRKNWHSSGLKKASLGTHVCEMTGLEPWQVRAVLDRVRSRTALGWKDLPRGWTMESVKSYWATLTGDAKHKVTKCMKDMAGKVTDPAAFCASLRDMIEGTTYWRGPSRRAAWEKLPRGWTRESALKYWATLTGDAKHKATKCMKDMAGKVTDPAAFCASLKDYVEGTTKWRKGPKKTK